MALVCTGYMQLACTNEPLPPHKAHSAICTSHANVDGRQGIGLTDELITAGRTPAGPPHARLGAGEEWVAGTGGWADPSVWRGRYDASHTPRLPAGAKEHVYIRAEQPRLPT